MAEHKKPNGPYLAAALFCEGIIEDQRGLVSALNILDGCQILLPPNTPQDIPSPTHRLSVTPSLLLIFRTGSSPGKHVLKLVIEQPDGRRNDAKIQEIDLPPEPNAGTNIKTQAILAVYSAGIFWVDVFLDDELFTRMPLNISIKRLDTLMSFPEKAQA